MNKLTPFLALLGVMALTGCPDGGTDLTDDSDDGSVDCDPDATFPDVGPLSAGDYTDCAPYTGDTRISYFPQPDCAGGTWSYDVELRGIASGVDLYVYNPGGTGEDPNQYGDGPHPMTDGATEANAWWDAFELDLDVVSAAPVDGESTLNGCENNNGSSLVWGFEALSVDDNSRVDCIVVYEDAVTEAYVSNFEAYHSSANLGDCDEIDGWTAE